jgi:hypothetical protein
MKLRSTLIHSPKTTVGANSFANAPDQALTMLDVLAYSRMNSLPQDCRVG